MATFTLLLGFGRTVMLRGVAGARPGFLYLVGASAQPVEPGRIGRTGDIARAEVVEMAAQRKLLRWTALGYFDDLFAAICLLAVAAFTVIRLHMLDIAEVLLRPVRPDLVGASSSGATTAPMSKQ